MASRRNRKPASRPVMEHELKASSTETQRFAGAADQGARRGLRALYHLDTVLPRLGVSEDEIAQLEKAAADAITRVVEAMDNRRRTLEEFAKDNGLETSIRYSAPTTETIEVSSPTSWKIAEVIKSMDALFEVVDALWVQGALSRSQHLDDTRGNRRMAFQLTRELERWVTELETRARAKGKMAAGDDAGQGEAASDETQATAASRSDLAAQEAG